MKYDLNTCRDFYQGKRVLVTGHTGFKGSWLCRILTLAGAQVTGYAAEAPTDPALFSIAGLADTMDSVIGDKTFLLRKPCVLLSSYMKVLILKEAVQ